MSPMQLATAVAVIATLTLAGPSPAQRGASPQLAIESIEQSPHPGLESSALTVTIVLVNKGSTPSPAGTELVLECRNKVAAGPPCPLGSRVEKLSAIAAGEKLASMTLTPNWQGGSYELRAWVGSARQTQKTATLTVGKSGPTRLQPGDSGATATVPSASSAGAQIPRENLKPDLQLTVKVYGGGTLYPVAVTVKNTGLAAAGANTFRMVCEAKKGGAVVAKCLSNIEVPVPPLAPGASAQLAMPYAPALSCDPQKTGIDHCLVTATVDVHNVVDELDEKNNVQLFQIAP